MPRKARVCPVCNRAVSTRCGRFVEHGDGSLGGVIPPCDGSGTISSGAVRVLPVSGKIKESVRRVKSFVAGGRSVGTRQMPHGMASIAAMLAIMSMR